MCECESSIQQGVLSPSIYKGVLTMIYKSAYSKCFHINNNKPYSNGFLEIIATKYPFHTGGILRLLNGERDLHTREWTNFAQLLHLVKHYKRELQKQ
jgi:hypothetical protein